MNRATQRRPDHRFAIGLFAGAALGAAIAMWYDLRRRGEVIRDGLADSVARGAREVERIATAAKTDPPGGG